MTQPLNPRTAFSRETGEVEFQIPTDVLRDDGGPDDPWHFWRMSPAEAHERGEEILRESRSGPVDLLLPPLQSGDRCLWPLTPRQAKRIGQMLLDVAALVRAGGHLEN